LSDLSAVRRGRRPDGRARGADRCAVGAGSRCAARIAAAGPHPCPAFATRSDAGREAGRATRESGAEESEEGVMSGYPKLVWLKDGREVTVQSQADVLKLIAEGVYAQPPEPEPAPVAEVP